MKRLADIALAVIASLAAAAAPAVTAANAGSSAVVFEDVRIFDGTDIPFDPAVAATQGSALAKMVRWYTPAGTLQMATADNAAQTVGGSSAQAARSTRSVSSTPGSSMKTCSEANRL